MGPGPEMGLPGVARRLSLTELASEADTAVDRIERLVAIGALQPAADGSFGQGDVIRCAVVASFERAGIGLEVLEQGIAEHRLTLDHVERFYPDPGHRSSRSFGEFATSLGEPGRRVGPLIAAMGVARPEDDQPITVEEEALLRSFIGAWDLPGEDVVGRAARVAGAAAAQVAEGWVGLFDEVVSGPAAKAGLTVGELVPRVVEPGGRVAALVYPLMSWLIGRHLTRIMDELNVDAIETALAARGLLPSRPDDPPAIVFADLAGYTRLTEELGDEGAAGVALRLAELALETAGRRGGRLVKLLGDGVMLQFARPRAAVEAALDLVGAVEAAGLPVAHVGIDAGRVIARDGDFFGRTVILASRLSGAAGPGEVLVSSSVVAAVAAADAADPVSHRPLTFGPLGTIHLKGITDPVEVHRVAR